MATDKPHFPTITASSKEQFDRIEQKLRRLPQVVLDNIKNADEGLSGIRCYIDKYKLFSDKTLRFPNTVHSIKQRDTECVLYARDFIFEIPIGEGHPLRVDWDFNQSLLEET